MAIYTGYTLIGVWAMGRSGMGLEMAVSIGIQSVEVGGDETLA